MSRDSHLAINEITGIRFQGEGRNIGKPIIIVRTYGCNLACGWCDSANTWDVSRFPRESESKLLTVMQVAIQIKRLSDEAGGHVKHLMITGGEPMLQQVALYHLMIALGPGWSNEVETAGTIAPLTDYPMADAYNVSLKLAHSGNAFEARYKPDAIYALRDTGKASWKFVAQQMSDFEEIDRLVQHFDLKPVYIMPEGLDAQTIMERSPAIADAALARGYSFSTRLHVLLYGMDRGR
jgi:7-carboxy-7-deazaguanine synthase